MTRALTLPYSAPLMRAEREPADRRNSARNTMRVFADVNLAGEPRMKIGGVVDNIAAKGMRLRLTEMVPISSRIRVEVLGDTFFGIVRYCDAAPDYREFYAGIEFEHHLDSSARKKYSLDCDRYLARSPGR